MPGLSTRLLAGAGLLLLSATTMAQIVAPLPPPMPWRGASENLPVPAGHAWITPAEASGFDTSPTHAESHAYLRRLAAASPLLTVESFGLSPQGREMIVVHARKPGNGAKPLVLVEAGIHPGEIDCSDAGSAASFARERRRETLAAGSVRVPADQPLALVAAALLEPESPHGALANNFFPGMLQRTEYMEAYVIAPMAEAMLKADPKLKAEFAAKLAADPDFAADGNRRLAWFYQRSPYYDDRYLLFPVGREIPPAPEAGAPPR
jgi:hypothetical protein